MSDEEIYGIDGTDGARDHVKRFNTVTDEGERIRKLISGDPMKFLHTNGG